MKGAVFFNVVAVLSAGALGSDAAHGRLRGLMSLHGELHHRVLARAPDGTPSFIMGDLGTIEGFDENTDRRRLADISKSSGKQALMTILTEKFGATGSEEMKTTDHKITKDEQGNAHFRYQELIHGMPVEGAAMVMHVSKKGIVFAVNGEFAADKEIPFEAKLDAETALEKALKQSGILSGEWLGTPELTVVYGQDGKAHLAWKNLLGHTPELGPRQRDVIFASAETGALVAWHPKVVSGLRSLHHDDAETTDLSVDYPEAQEPRSLADNGIPSLVTQDCHQGTSYCSTVSNSSFPINTGDPAIDAAHNNAIATYNYFYDNFGRDSIDDNGMTLVSRVHYDKNWFNAQWDGSRMTYGDGDGVVVMPFSLDADVVAHEITHGVSDFSSGLIQAFEPGTLQEVMSDIFGAAVDRQEGASVAETWILGEDIIVLNSNLTDPASMLGVRSLADPAVFGQPDYYPDRYIGIDDFGGTHINCGIGSLAFYLLVEGGLHPRNKTQVYVDAIDPDDFDKSLQEAAKIFYNANTACLTPGSTFVALRHCTADIHGGPYSSNVHEAWDAVGVPNEPPPQQNGPIPLTSGVPLHFQWGAANSDQQYVLEGVKTGEMVRCDLLGFFGDADLHVRFDPRAADIECDCFVPFLSVEKCVTGAVEEDSTAYIYVHGSTGYAALSIACWIIDPVKLENGVTLSDQSGKTWSEHYYVLEDVDADKPVACNLTGDNGNANVYVSFDKAVDWVQPFIEPGCVGFGPSSNEHCMTEPANSDTNAYITVAAATGYTNLSITCETPKPIPLAKGIPLEGQSAVKGWVQPYVLDGVLANQMVTCSLAGDNGDADLYVRLGTEAAPNPNAEENDCMSHGKTSNEECTTGLAVVPTTAYITVHAFADYNDLSVTCESEYPN